MARGLFDMARSTCPFRKVRFARPAGNPRSRSKPTNSTRRTFTLEGKAAPRVRPSFRRFGSEADGADEDVRVAEELSARTGRAGSIRIWLGGSPRPECVDCAAGSLVTGVRPDEPSR